MDLRLTKRAVLLACALTVSLVGTAVVAAHPGTPSSGIIHACVDKEGKLRIVSETDGCKDKDSPLDWNAQGIQGPQGPQGAQGLQGEPGPIGPAGPAGSGSGLPSVPTDSKMFLKIEGVPGDSQDPAHLGEIEVLSFQWPRGVSGRPEDLSSLGETRGFWVTFKGGSATANIFGNARGWPPARTFPSATLTVRSTGPNPVDFLTWHFPNVWFGRYTTSMEAGASLPRDTVELVTDTASYEFRPRLTDGTYGPPVTGCCSPVP